MRDFFILTALCFAVGPKLAFGLGCIPRICDGNDQNEFKHCKDGRNDCGRYGSERFGNRLVHAVDLHCDIENKIFAPFNGTIEYHSPFGDQSCIDQGIKIVGQGAWSGYDARISYMRPYQTSGEVQQGDLLGVAVNVRDCSDVLGKKLTNNHVVFELIKHGQPIDPTTHLQNCMCSGQICQSNTVNALDGEYKSDERFGRGFELSCQNTEAKSSDGDAHVPFIYAPIDGKALYRVRLRDPMNNRADCTNDALLVIGDGKWKDYTVRIYNSKFLIEPGEKPIKQGEIIGKRLDCPGVDSIFIEFRKRGKLVNIKDQILGLNCTDKAVI